MDYTARAIPFFIFFIVVEWFLSHRKQDNEYSLKDTLSNLSCGLLQVFTTTFFILFTGISYIYIYNHLAPFHQTPSLYTWLAIFLGVDFCYYWFHRASHRMALFWAFHVVHHQSEKYNLSVALRQSGLGASVSWIFYLPLAYLGFSPAMMATTLSINLLYQFWIHTSLIKTLGPVEFIFNTPSHHRVHHGSNEKYLDKNYAGILIIWDKLFGTFIKEEEKPVYGLVHPIKNFNPIWANFHVWVELFELSRNTKMLREKFSIYLKPPGEA